MPGLTRTLLRRWPYTLLLALVCGVVCFGVAKVVPPSYSATASVVIIPPPATTDPNGNRYLLLSGINPARDILMRSITSDQTKQAIVEGTDGGEYTVEADFTTSAPLIMVTTEAPTAKGAATLLSRVLDRLPTTLDAMQDQLKVERGARLTVQELSRSADVERVGKSQMRAVLAAGGLTAILGVLLIGVIDGLILRRNPSHKPPPRSQGLAGAPPPARPTALRPVMPPTKQRTAVSPAEGRADSDRRGGRVTATRMEH